MATAFITHPDTLLHVMDGSHPESPARITAIRNALISSGLMQKLQTHEAPLATDEQLQRVHTTEYVGYIQYLFPKMMPSGSAYQPGNTGFPEVLPLDCFAEAGFLASLFS